MKHTLEFETIINCTTEELFRFHADTKNLPLITPPGTTVHIIKLEKELKEGNTASLKIQKGLLSFVWELIFEKVEYPTLIVDVATKSPFKSFRHEHRFIPIDNSQTILKDKVTFSLPFGILSTPVVWFIEHDMKKMFRFRHHETKRILENPSA
jgi:ligand-binding SRPBCC domain-containing protein